MTSTAETDTEHMGARMNARMSAADRRALVLAAATRAFSRSGYAGTSTDAVAREAGVSQPYVVRIFGSKLELFLEVLTRACDRVRDTFAGVLDAAPFDPADEDDWLRLGLSYSELLRDRDLLMVMMHGFAAGDDERIARCGRDGMGRIAKVIMDTGATPDRARDFFAHGMLMNVMLSMHAHTHLDEGSALSWLTTCAFGESLDLLS